ncbi:peptidase S41-like protein [Flavobacterium croceum DSM 17960]|uniref:Peptidase S41-like protein n=1 Tax=Flavobacterium croceum DSM 17960 TaxID=1121886 RepID=A0A2S4N8G0_9FLAO|nr:S41 family peptidase [Flavobacterium croceum]POS01985.1 peptidase S41-like protein [Flavobacterium croceum DSM 17960]
MKKIFTLIALLTVTIFFGQEIKTEDWTTDLNFLKTELPKKHKNLFFKVSKQDFEAELNKIILNLDKDSDVETSIKLTQLIAKIGDTHTMANISSFFKSRYTIPLNLNWFKEGLFVTGTSKNNYEILDKKIVAINNFKVEQIVDSLKTLFVDENLGMVKTNTDNLIRVNALLKYFGFSKNNENSYSIEVEDLEGKKYYHTLNEIETDNVKKDFISTKLNTEKPFYLNGSGKFFKDEYFAQDKIYYIQYNKCISKETVEKYGDKDEAYKYPSFDEFSEKIIKTINEKDIDKLIFDIRFNKGGSSYLAENLINKIAENKKLNKKGKLFLVVGSDTFSSAIFNAVYFKEKTNVITIGEETSGKPNHYGFVGSFVLPYSQIKINYSKEYWKLTDDNVNTLPIDYKIETSFQDYKNGLDKAYEFVKNFKN